MPTWANWHTTVRGTAMLLPRELLYSYIYELSEYNGTGAT